MELVNVGLTIAGAAVLRGASVAVRRGEIMGLCAEEEAVKSAALQVASGGYAAHEYSGEVRVDGVATQLCDPRAARDLGIVAVHRESLCAPELTVAEHLLLGREPTRFGLIDGARLELAARALLADFACASAIDARASLSDLSLAQRRLVEIMRCLARAPKILLLDEPSAGLGPRENSVLARWLGAARARGVTTLYASRHCDELFERCDRITVLRQGRTAARFETRECEPENVVHALLGRELRGASEAI